MMKIETTMYSLLNLQHFRVVISNSTIPTVFQESEKMNNIRKLLVTFYTIVINTLFFIRTS